MPPEDLRERLEAELDELRDDVEELRGELAFSEVVEAVTETQARLPELREGLQRLRARGYAFRGDLEQTLADVTARAEPLLRTLHDEIRRAQDHLHREARELSRDVGRITGDPVRQQGQIRALAGRARALKRELEETTSRLKALAEPVTGPAAEVGQRTKDLHWTLDQFDEATFKLQPEERPIAAARATWEDAPGGEKPVGLLMFSDHRVFFEQKEERVTTRKFIFFTAETEKLHRLLLDEPVGHLQDSTDTTRGWVIADQLLTFAWSTDARAPRKTTFELDGGTAKDWDGVVELIRTGDLGRYTVGEQPAAAPAAEVPASAPPPAAAHKVRWPEKCASCDAPLSPPVKGQTSIACDYCATGHKVEFVTE